MESIFDQHAHIVNCALVDNDANDAGFTFKRPEKPANSSIKAKPEVDPTIFLMLGVFEAPDQSFLKVRKLVDLTVVAGV